MVQLLDSAAAAGAAVHFDNNPFFIMGAWTLPSACTGADGLLCFLSAERLGMQQPGSVCFFEVLAALLLQGELDFKV